MFKYTKEGVHGVMVELLDCNFEVSEFKLYSYYYIHFQTNILKKI